MTHFAEEKVYIKLPLVFSKDNTWNCWREVFVVGEAKELIEDVGSEPSLVLWVPMTNITKTDIVPTLG